MLALVGILRLIRLVLDILTVPSALAKVPRVAKGAFVEWHSCPLQAQLILNSLRVTTHIPMDL
ncbi:6895_t:CDS:1, partial [Acaulospora colombiana]